MLAADTDRHRDPRDAASAYGLVMRTTESARNIGSQVFAQATAAMQEADLPDAHFTSRLPPPTAIANSRTRSACCWPARRTYHREPRAS